MITRINNALDASRLKREENEKGFTLIELLVVVIIIGILAAIAIPVFLNQREAAWRASVESDLKNAATVIETYGTQNNGTFSGITVLSWTDTTTGDLTGGTTGLTINVSDGNTLTITLSGTTGYSIEGKNENLTPTLTYNSATGGLGDWTP